MKKITVKIKPNSKDESVKLIKDMFGNEIYEVRVKAPPIDGKANKELIELLAKYFQIPKRNIEIKSGFTSRSKIIIIKEI